MLPFRYMIGFPVEVLTGALTREEAVVGFAFQLGWLAVALFLYRFLWQCSVKHYLAIGG